jgi:thioredoxin 2
MLIRCPSCQKTNRFPKEKLSQVPVCGVCSKELLLAPIELIEDSFSEFIDQNELPVLVDFWAPWCGPCKSFAPTFEKLAKEFGNQLLYCKVNTEQEERLAMKYSIRSIPTLVVFYKGQEIGRVSGALPLPQLKELSQNVLEQIKAL